MALSRATSEQSVKLSSTTTSESSTDHERHPSIETRICLIGNARNDDDLKKNLKDLNVSFVASNDGHEYIDADNSNYETVFIVDDFESDIFNELKQTHIRILGPPVISAVAQLNTPLPYNTRPLYCTCMQGINLCFTNFKTKDHLAHLVTLCHYMGACIRKEMTSKIDYLVTNSLHGPKYRTAVSLGTPVMKEEWVHKCWAARSRRTLFKATDDEFLSPCKSKPFEGCKLSFLGFSDDEKRHMEEQAVQQGGLISEVGNPTCTHLVVEERSVKTLPFVPEGRIYIVVQEWFWGSIQIEAKAAESMYIFDLVEYPKRLAKFSSTSSLLGTPRWKGSSSGVATRASTGRTSLTRKRVRLREETLAKLAQETEGDSSRPCKRPSTDTSACISDSMLDHSNSASAVKSPADLFTPRRRSSRVKARRKGRRSEADQRSAGGSSFRYPAQPDSVTPPELITHLRQLVRSSPTTHDCNGRYSSSCTTADGNSMRSKRPSSSRRFTRIETSIGLAVCDVAETEHFNEEPAYFLRSLAASRQSELASQQRRHSTALPLLPAKSCDTRSRLSVSGNELPVLSEDVVDLDSSDSVSSSTLVEERASEDSDVSLTDATLKVRGSCVREKGPGVVASARYQVAMEFLQTEKNYVGILQTILNLFKTPLDDPNQPGGAILPSEDIKAIFGSLPEMEVVHRSMRDRLEEVLNSWNPASCVGSLVSSYVDGLGRCYPPFVNFFEASVETINRCDAKSPRFHAFLKINQAKKECGRQTLAELLINPVQRIPRIILLLQDIKKHTEREKADHPDVKEIEGCLEALKGVMAHINEDKRKTESQRQVFDIVYEVEGCPPTLVSSHRQFVSRAEVLAVDDNLCARGDYISIFVFTDCVEIAKRRRGTKAVTKSPNVHSRPPSSAKSMKHIKLMSLLHIKKVVDIKDSEDCEDAFAFYCRTPTDSQDWLYTFKILYCSEDSTKPPSDQNVTANKENIPGSGNSKQQLLSVLSRHRTNALCKTNDDNFLCSVNAHELDVSTTDLGSTLGRAVRAAKKSSRKLTRAFSFSRTPRRAVQRAVSNLLSPAVQGRTHEESGNDESMDNVSQTSSLTPSVSVTSLCTPQRERPSGRVPSTSSLQLDEEMDVHCLAATSSLKPAFSTLSLARPQTAADKSDFPAVPTPPTRRKRVGATLKAATITLGRTGSFRRRKKLESIV